MMRMLAAAAGMLLALACVVEDRTPTGSRRDDEAIQRLLQAYTRSLESGEWDAVRSLCWGEATYLLATPTGNLVLPIDSARSHLLPAEHGALEVRLLRSDARQEGDLASAWLMSGRRRAGGEPAGERDWTEHLTLRRIGGEWKILAIAPAHGVRRRG
jgi:hypothetical protein